MTKVALNYSEKLENMVQDSELSIREALALWVDFFSKHKVSYDDYSWVESNIVELGRNALRYPVGKAVYIDINCYFREIAEEECYNTREYLATIFENYILCCVTDYKLNIRQYDFLKKALECIIEN